MTHRVSMRLIASDEAQLDVCWHNLCLCDQYHILDLFAICAVAWIRLTGLGYDDLERELRNRMLHTVLIAAPFSPGGGLVLALGEQQRELRYRCVFSCRPHKLALEEMNSFGVTYEENLVRLAHAGDLHTEQGIFRANGLTEVLMECGHKLQLVSQPVPVEPSVGESL
jgi:hypothetical protein